MNFKRKKGKRERDKGRREGRKERKDKKKGNEREKKKKLRLLRTVVHNPGKCLSKPPGPGDIFQKAVFPKMYQIEVWE